MDTLIINTVDFLIKSLFSSLVLIGLLITVLSFILNLKDSNVYIEKFKQHTNILNFVDKIFQTIVILIIIFLLGLVAHFIIIPKEFLTIDYYIFGLFSFISLLLIVSMIINLYSIAYMIKEIVKTSLK